MQKDVEDSKWAWDTMPDDGGEPRPVYCGDMEDWDSNETRRRSRGDREPWGGVWTEPLTPGATKAKWGKSTFDSGRYRCCHDLEHCGVGVAVKQGPIQGWHFQRQWNNWNNSEHRWTCKNESQYKGESRFHNTTTRTIARILKNKTTFQGKEITRVDWEKNKSIRTSKGDTVNLKPDVFVQFSEKSWYAIEVVYTHKPERDAHDVYKTHMVVIDLKQLNVVESDQKFNEWVRNGGIEKALEIESSESQRNKRFNERQQAFTRQDEKDFKAMLQTEYSKCREKFGFSVVIDFPNVSDVSEIKEIFNQERVRRDLIAEIREAIEKNVEKYGERLDRSVDDFTSVKEVNDYYRNELGEKLKRKKKADAEMKRQRTRRINAEAKEAKAREAEAKAEAKKAKAAAKAEAKAKAAAKAEEAAKAEAVKQRIKDLSERMHSEFELQVEKLTAEFESCLENLGTVKVSEILRTLTEIAEKASSLSGSGFFIHLSAWGGHKPQGIAKSLDSVFLDEVNMICDNHWPNHHCFKIKSIETVKFTRGINKKHNEIYQQHKENYAEYYEWLAHLRSELVGWRKAFQNVFKLINERIGTRPGKIASVDYVERIIDLGIDPQINLPLVDKNFWAKPGISSLFSDLNLEEIWTQWVQRKEDEERKAADAALTTKQGEDKVRKQNQNRRKKSEAMKEKYEPFNPFSKDASAKRNQRHNQKQKTPNKPLTREERLANLRKDSAKTKATAKKYADERDSNS